MLERQHAVHENIFDAHRGAVGIFKSSDVANRVRIENSNIRKIILAQQAAVVEVHALCRQRSKFADGRFQWKHVLLAYIPAKDARKRPVPAWMRL